MSRQTIAWNSKKPCKLSFCRAFAVRTRLELATSAVTGRHSNQLNYRTRVAFDFWLLPFLNCVAKVVIDFLSAIAR